MSGSISWNPGCSGVNVKFALLPCYPVACIFRLFCKIMEGLKMVSGKAKHSSKLNWMRLSFHSVPNFPLLVVSWHWRIFALPRESTEADSEQWGFSCTIKYFHSGSVWLANTKRLPCDIHHTAEDLSKLGLSDKCFKLIIPLPPLLLWRHWSNCVDRAWMKYQVLGNAELA